MNTYKRESFEAELKIVECFLQLENLLSARGFNTNIRLLRMLGKLFFKKNLYLNFCKDKTWLPFEFSSALGETECRQPSRALPPGHNWTGGILNSCKTVLHIDSVRGQGCKYCMLTFKTKLQNLFLTLCASVALKGTAKVRMSEESDCGVPWASCRPQLYLNVVQYYQRPSQVDASSGGNHSSAAAFNLVFFVHILRPLHWPVWAKYSRQHFLFDKSEFKKNFHDFPNTRSFVNKFQKNAYLQHSYSCWEP